MKIVLDTPVWYSSDKLYISNVVETDITLISEPSDITNAKHSEPPSSTAQEQLLNEIAPLLFDQIKSWFSASLSLEKLRKKIVCEMKPLTISSEPRWVSFVWTPKHFSIDAKTFKLMFEVVRMDESKPRIPFTFLDEESASPAPAQVAALPAAASGAPPSVLDEIPYSTEQPIVLRDRPTQEKQTLQQAKLRAAIARLKVEELREKYIRTYGDDDEDEDEEDDDEEGEDDDEESEPKK